MVKIQIFMTFTPCRGENTTFTQQRGKNSDLHYAVVKIHLEHAMVKIHIYKTFTPCHGEN